MPHVDAAVVVPAASDPFGIVQRLLGECATAVTMVGVGGRVVLMMGQFGERVASILVVEPFPPMHFACSRRGGRVGEL